MNRTCSKFSDSLFEINIQMHEYIYFNIKIKIAFLFATGRKYQIHVNYFFEVEELGMYIAIGFGIVCRKSVNHPLQ